jgi:hypothetical protein
MRYVKLMKKRTYPRFENGFVARTVELAAFILNFLPDTFLEF